MIKRYGGTLETKNLAKLNVCFNVWAQSAWHLSPLTKGILAAIPPKNTSYLLEKWSS